MQRQMGILILKIGSRMEIEIMDGYDIAFRAALSLASPKRITADVREALNNAILKVLSTDGISEGERNALDRLKS